MNILAIGAHADDVELGAGGSLLKWARAGHSVTIYTATNSEYRSPDGKLIRSAAVAAKEAETAAAVFGADLITGPFDCFQLDFGSALNVALLDIVQSVRPDLVVSHWSGDTHPDHKALAQATLHTAKHVPRILQYASNWYMGCESFDARYFVDISETLEDKLKLIEIYASENARSGGKWIDFFRNQAAMYGSINGVSYAEPFHAIRFLEG